MKVAAVLWLTKVAVRTPLISEFWRPQQHVGRENQRQNAIDRIKQNGMPRSSRQDFAVAM